MSSGVEGLKKLVSEAAAEGVARGAVVEEAEARIWQVGCDRA